MIKRIVNYCGYVIYYDTELGVYSTALNRDGTDTHFSSIEKAFDAIDKKVGVKRYDE